ncbi:hypothetical protein CBR_g5727 [Chara braunii]|uniref:SEC7 domain-containing protein n=1 Tax=Chara braunii TaxID=69332 RepID=A0A388KJ93_CHABU|nr:hypothetical protein CBR_g5727 [Chara braunii]|eukprot:GBG70096.1 hypothetical protein CBR_g5727 [Chara braunii]
MFWRSRDREPAVPAPVADPKVAFISRSIERLLKDASGRKYSRLQQACKAYIDRQKVLLAAAASTPSAVEVATEVSSETTEEIEAKTPQAASIDGENGKLETSPVSEQAPSLEEGKTTSESAAPSPRSVEDGVPKSPKQGKGDAAAAGALQQGNSLDDEEVELATAPLRLAFETKNAKLVETALDCMHKLIAYGHLEGEAGVEGGVNGMRLTQLVNMVCSCAESSSASDSVVLQVIKVLLTAVTSNSFQVHGECLLASIRTCYNIVLSSKNAVNQATAKATLSQMINVVFKRMETGSPGMGGGALGATYAGKHTRSATVPELQLDSSGHHLPARSVSGRGIDAALEKMDLTSRTSDQGHSPKSVASSVGSGSPLHADNASGMPVVTLEEIQTMAGDADIKGLEAALDKAAHPEGKKHPEGIDLNSLNLVERDALLLFRTLCKMSNKEGTDDLMLRTKLLSLEFLQGVLENVGPSFTRNFAFIDSVKHHLSASLIRACLSPVPAIFQFAANIFSVLLLRFRASLKAEIGVFFPLLVLRYVDSNDASALQRTVVLRMLDTIAMNSQALADVFVNYDCDLDATNLFEKMVNSLSRLAQTRISVDPESPVAVQIQALKGSALQCLVTTMKSLAQWAKKGEDSSKGEASSQNPDNAIISPVMANGHASDLGSRNSSIDWSEKDGDITKISESEGETQADRFGKAKAHKSSLEAGVSEFNLKPLKGIRHLVNNKIIPNEPAAIARFLRNTPGLDKTAVGDYLGQHDDFSIAVMHAYVDLMNFSGMRFDMAIREFLAGFRLPGEAQKVDRMMEKFAERYCRDNPSLFQSADTAYALGYAVIMLNTDLHNPLVWPKMTKAEFVRMFTATGSGQEEVEAPPVEMLEELYDVILADELKMRDDASPGSVKSRAKDEEKSRIVSVLNLTLPRRASVADAKKESEEIVRRTQALFRKGNAKRGVFYTASQPELARAMVESVGWPLLAAFSVTMEDSEAQSRVALCMEGVRLGIHLTKVLGMETMRYAFLTSLIRFTFLHAPKEMRTKNVEALRSLLSMAGAEPDALQDAWNAVLECVSRLEHITSSPSMTGALMVTAPQVVREGLIGTLKELAGEPSERIFVSSVKLPSDSIVEFFNALCGVSAEELKMNPPRVYSLQKLVEISYYNMSRIRLVWARIWAVLSSHFVTAGGHPDLKISMYAIDSLRQLAIKYLERAELANFTFQNDIMKPFVVIMRTNKTGEIRELIVQCIVQMIDCRVGSIKSGWRSVFMVFTTAASDSVKSIVDGAFDSAEQVVLEHFDQVSGDCFMDCVNCLISFANNKMSAGISLKAVALLRICADRLAEGLVTRPSEEGPKKDDHEVVEYYWFPMLAGLSDLTSDPRADVRRCALEVLFDMLKERGHSFSSAFWESVFHRVLFPMFDYVRHAGTDSGKTVEADEWLREACIHCLQLLCDLFCLFYEAVSFMLPTLLRLLLDCATRSDQGLAAISAGAMLRLLETGGHLLKDNDWNQVLDTIGKACSVTSPVELYDPEKLFASPNDCKEASQATTDENATLSEDKETASAPNATPTKDGGKEGSSGPLTSRTDGRDGSKAGSWGGAETSASQADTKGDEKAQAGESSRDGPSTVDAADYATPSQRWVMASFFSDNASAAKRMMNNVMDALMLKNLMLRRAKPLEASLLARPTETGGDLDESFIQEPEVDANPDMRNVRCKCVVQLLLLGVLDKIQSKYWDALSPRNKHRLMDLVQSMAEFAAQYNSDEALRQRIQSFIGDRPPPCLLRQEVEGTSVYITVLFRAIGDLGETRDSESDLTVKVREEADEEEREVKAEAEARLVKLCERVLQQACNGHPEIGDVPRPDMYQALALRTPVVVRVLTAMCTMCDKLFKRHLVHFYPHFTRLICCDQMEVRRALGELFRARLIPLLP